MQASIQRVLLPIRHVEKALAWNYTAALPAQESRRKQGHYLFAGETLLLGAIHAQN